LSAAGVVKGQHPARVADAGKRDGSIRDDAEAPDVLLLIGALSRTAPGEEDRSQRMLDVILDGIRTHPQS
jgi:hypothetical protein